MSRATDNIWDKNTTVSDDWILGFLSGYAAAKERPGTCLDGLCLTIYQRRALDVSQKKNRSMKLVSKLFTRLGPNRIPEFIGPKKDSRT